MSEKKYHESYLSWSGSTILEDCPLKFYHTYVARTPPSNPDNRVHMLYGETIGRLFQIFYRDQVWRSKDIVGGMNSAIKYTMKRIIMSEQRKGGVFDFKDETLKEGSRSLQEVYKEVVDTIPRALKTIKEHRLLGPEVATELGLDTELEGHLIAGRADFAMDRNSPNNDRILLDGKGSKYGGEYTDKRQVYWYAMLHREQYGSAPDKVGYLYWKLEPKEAVEWLPVTGEILDSSKKRALTLATSAAEGKKRCKDGEPFQEVFLAKPSSDCKLCSYRNICPTYQIYSSEDTKKAAKDSFLAGALDGTAVF